MKTRRDRAAWKCRNSDFREKWATQKAEGYMSNDRPTKLKYNCNWDLYLISAYLISFAQIAVRRVSTGIHLTVRMQRVQECLAMEKVVDGHGKESGKSILTKRQRMRRSLRVARQKLEKRSHRRNEINTRILIPVLYQKACATWRVGRKIC